MIVDLMDTAAKAIMGLALDGHVNNNDEETSKTEPTVKKRSPEDQIKIFQDLTKNFNDLIEVRKYKYTVELLVLLVRIKFNISL